MNQEINLEEAYQCNRSYILYIIYGAFLINVFFNKFNFIFLPVIAIWIIAESIFHNNKKIITIELIPIILYIITIPLNNVEYKGLFFLISLYSFSLLFLLYKYKEIEIIKFVNITYFIYFCLSLMVYFNFIPASVINRDVLNIFDVETQYGLVKTLVGFEGSTAHIDSYSAFVFLINLLLNKNKSKYFLMVISFAAMLLTFRMTPLIGLGAVVIFYFVPEVFRKPVFIITFLCSVFSFILAAIPGFTNSFVMNFTHNRSLIWEQFSQLIYQKFGEIIFGYKEIPFVKVYFAITQNPHSTYLNILLKFGIISFVIIFSYFTLRFVKCDNKKYLTILLLIFIVGITNSEILYIKNPVYLIFIYYVMQRVRLKEEQKFIGPSNA